MTHMELLSLWPSAYRMAIETGIPQSTCRRWQRQGEITDWRQWETLVVSAKRYGRLSCDVDAVLASLAKDRG